MAELLAKFKPIFYPRSIAVIGASADRGKFGGMFLNSLLSFGYKGKVYPVNPRETEILGLNSYARVSEIPEVVDFAVITVPADLVPGVVRECLTKGIKAAEILTAGFRELGERGQELEEEIARIAKEGIRLIGPNCFGVYCPTGGITIMPGGDFSKESGSVGLISQSGGWAVRVPRLGNGLGIKFSKVISYGNACDINECDLLEYLGQDPEIKIIAGYLEGVKDGRRFLQVLQKVCHTKPVILWKGGFSPGGARAVYSHTGSLSGAETVWKALFRQTGAIRVNSLAELLDTLLAFYYLPPIRGRKTAVVGGGGAIGVSAADNCEQAGLFIPLFSDRLQQKLKTLLPPVGASYRNPVDVGSPYPPPGMLREVLRAVVSEGDIDMIIVDEIELTTAVSSSRRGDKEFLARMKEVIQIPVTMRKELGKPLAVVLPVDAVSADRIDVEADRRKVSDYYLKEGIPVYTSIDRAARALANMVGYYERVNS
jgi:acyl-CoA synthetase (NDP forming)